jgi:D-aminopeptidase
MTSPPRVFDAEGRWWSLPPGPHNAITDVAGVTVGHAALREGRARTGVTAVLPHGGDLFRRRVVAGVATLNGFGKSAGLMQLEELGEIETPILLTNPMAVPACAQALTRIALEANPGIGRGQPSLNALVLECNDGVLNDMQALAVTEAHVRAALAAAGEVVAQGTVGADTGMCSFGMAGGIGSASRIVRTMGAEFTLGTLVLSNFGQPGELRVLGRRVQPPGPPVPDQGSIILLFATDAPMDPRQLTRLARRAGPGLGRLGSFLGHGSGDVAVAFSTANPIEAPAARATERTDRLAEAAMDAFFLAAVETVEEAVLHALWHADGTPGYDGTILPTLRQVLGA